MSARLPSRPREATALIPLRWGSYRERYLGGLWLIVGGGIAIAGSDTFALWLLWLGSGAAVIWLMAVVFQVLDAKWQPPEQR